MPRVHRLLFALLVLLTVSCRSRTEESAAPAASAAASAAPGSLTLTVVYGSEKKTWLEEQAKLFAASGAKTKDGRPIVIDARAMGSGEAVQAIVSGAVKPHVFSPASSVYVALLNDAYLAANPSRRGPLVRAGEPLVLSSVVLAMWKPMAEALGWPQKALSWADLLAVATNPKGWAAYGFPEWGRFKLGHCHPEFSNSGYLAVLAEAYAGAKKARNLSVADLDDKRTQDFVARVEETIVHYGKSTGFFAEKMAARGPSYLSAAVLYENLVIESYAKGTNPPIVAVYPADGTFWSDHPYSVVDADWVGDGERAAADAFAAFLRARPAQERALALGFRPADPSIPIGAPIDKAHGVDPKQPQNVLPVPSGAVLERLLTVWKATKKGADVIIAFDKSGSMGGQPLAQAQRGAKSFLSTLGDRDEATLLLFDGHVYPPIGPVRMDTGRPSLMTRIDGIVADGGTALYDAVAAAADLARSHAAAAPNRTHAVLVMTDGKDENSKMSLADLKRRFPSDETAVKVFTIAYGAQAEGKVLEEIAEAGRGASARGSVDTIRDVFLDMASFF